ncbi:MAG: hypothetical protein AAFV53_15115, partial [Myxococcota bacterium]
MTGISRDVPLQAYDLIVDLLMADASSVGIDRPHLDTLIDTLRREGRGTEALAAELVFTMVDHVDHEKRQMLTRAHLDRARGYFAKTLHSRGGVLSEIEIAQMSPTVRALLEIGQMLTVDKQPGRIAHRVPRQGMDHIANMLRLLARPDGAITRADRDLTVY